MARLKATTDMERTKEYVSKIYGRGLNDMRKRAANLHARLDIDSELNNGTLIKLEVPFTV